MARQKPILNPFTLTVIGSGHPFCNREREQSDLYNHGIRKVNVVLFSPRRYGKTSLVRRVQEKLKSDGVVTIYADFMGVSSVDDFAERLAKAVFRTTRKSESLFTKASKIFSSFRPLATISPDQETGFGLDLQLVPATGATGVNLLEEVMTSLDDFIKKAENPVHVVLDEFSEVVELKESAQLEGIMRTHIQNQDAAYIFVGSRRGVLRAMFSKSSRAFFQSALAYELKAIDAVEFAEFISENMAKSGIECDVRAVLDAIESVEGYPYYVQKLAYLAFDIAINENLHISEQVVERAFAALLENERYAFEAVLSGLKPKQIALLRALAIEPTSMVYGHPYLARHNISIGGTQSALKLLAEDRDLVEKRENVWRVVDPVMARWLRL